mmetsp:Transcript_40326/g.97338  ORF Transcript_40326/g.97338 Transcript_40326/m.97338 type:complete len:249 (+) Transcript_40326:67-813(+)
MHHRKKFAICVQIHVHRQHARFPNCDISYEQQARPWSCGVSSFVVPTVFVRAPPFPRVLLPLPPAAVPVPVPKESVTLTFPSSCSKKSSSRSVSSMIRSMTPPFPSQTMTAPNATHAETAAGTNTSLYVAMKAHQPGFIFPINNRNSSSVKPSRVRFLVAASISTPALAIPNAPASPNGHTIASLIPIVSNDFGTECFDAWTVNVPSSSISRHIASSASSSAFVANFSSDGSILATNGFLVGSHNATT